jgi:nucleotide-binding universal stress UspA family protein
MIGRNKPMKVADSKTRVALGNILMATDFSAHSEAALRYALSVARRYDSRIYVAHIVQPEILQPVMLGSVAPSVETVVRHAEQQMADLLVSGQLRGVPHQVLLGRGSLWPVLLGMIQEHEIDLVVVGTHGRTGVQKLVLGSVAEEIFRLAPCPVMTVGPRVSGDAPEEIRLRHIVHATDFSPAGQAAAAFALSLAQEYEAQLTLLHVVEDAAGVTGREREVLREATVRKLKAMVPLEAELWCEPEYAVEFGERGERILEVTHSRGADLAVLGVRRTGNFPGHLPPATAYKVAARAHCPVLTVRN